MTQLQTLDFISGFFIGAGVTGMAFGFYMFYICKKMIENEYKSSENICLDCCNINDKNKEVD